MRTEELISLVFTDWGGWEQCQLSQDSAKVTCKPLPSFFSPWVSCCPLQSDYVLCHCCKRVGHNWLSCDPNLPGPFRQLGGNLKCKWIAYGSCVFSFLEMPFNLLIQFSESTQKRQTCQQSPCPGPDQWHVSTFCCSSHREKHLISNIFDFVCVCDSQESLKNSNLNCVSYH